MLSEKYRNYIADKIKVKKQCGFQDEKYILPEDLKYAIINVCDIKDLVALFKDLCYEVVINYDVLIEQFFSKSDYKDYVFNVVVSLYGQYLDKFVDVYIKKDLSSSTDLYNLKTIAENTNNKTHFDFCMDILKSYKEGNYILLNN